MRLLLSTEMHVYEISEKLAMEILSISASCSKNTQV